VTRARVVVDLGAVRANLRTLAARHGGEGVWAVVKADGYGHGAAAVGRAALEAGAVGLAVATLAEAEALRAAVPGARLMVLSPLAPGEEARAGGLDVVASTPDGLARLRAAAPGVRVHVKVDTGMGRWGLAPAAALQAGRALAAGEPDPPLGGLMSHLATAEERDTAFAVEQAARFAAVAEAFPPCPRHLANSAGVLYVPAARRDWGRCGIALYGISPRDEDPADDGLAPVLSLTSEVRALRDLAPGESTGYGRAFVADVPQRVALVPVGYADGYPRSLALRTDALVRGRRLRVGPVSMDALALLVPADADVRVGDTVTLVGRDGGERVGLEELARALGTIAYELACGLRERAGRTEREVRDA
jgi:alanine racemase